MPQPGEIGAQGGRPGRARRAPPDCAWMRSRFEVRAGEVLGVAGRAGQRADRAGRGGHRPAHPCCPARSACWARTSPTPARARSPSWVSAHVPEDRQRDGLVLCFPDRRQPGAEHLLPAALREGRGAAGRRNPRTRPNAWSRSLISARPAPMTSAGSLSGGNQQKVIVAREFSRPIKLLVASQPTRGLDVGSIEYIHRRIVAKARRRLRRAAGFVRTG